MLIITDKINVKKGISINKFQAETKWKQELHHKISQYPFTLNNRININQNISRYIIECLTTRYFIMQLRVLDYPGILHNIINYCKKNDINKITLEIHEKNIVLAKYLTKNLSLYNIEVKLKIYKNINFSFFTISKNKNYLEKLKLSFIHYISIIGIFILLFLGKLADKLFHNDKIKKDFNLWMSFANNREKLDYEFIPHYNENNLNFLYPDIKRFFITNNKKDFKHSIYRFGKYNISAFKFLRLSLQLIQHFDNELANYLIEIEREYNIKLIQKYNKKNIYKLKFHALHYLLLILLLENIQKLKETKTILVYRGGNANGIYYSCLNNNKFINILLPHGTEFYPLDHAIYYLLDYNILPSREICNQWKSKDPAIMKYKCKLIPLGRPYYDYLGNHVKKRNDFSTYKVGIVLTYETLDNILSFILNIIQIFSTKYKKEKIIFIIKQRPNVTYDLSSILNDNVQEFNGDIFSFLNDINIVIVGISNMGVIGMVGLDAVYCEIPTIYYFPNKKKNQLGYSWHSSMKDISFFSYNDLFNFVNNYSLSQLDRVLIKNAKKLKYLIGNSKNSILKIQNFLIALNEKK